MLSPLRFLHVARCLVDSGLLAWPPRTFDSSARLIGARQRGSQPLVLPAAAACPGPIPIPMYVAIPGPAWYRPRYMPPACVRRWLQSQSVPPCHLAGSLSTTIRVGTLAMPPYVLHTHARAMPLARPAALPAGAAVSILGPRARLHTSGLFRGETNS